MPKASFFDGCSFRIFHTFAPFFRLLIAHIRVELFAGTLTTSRFVTFRCQNVRHDVTCPRIVFFFFLPEDKKKDLKVVVPLVRRFQHETFAFPRVDDMRKRKTQIGRRNEVIYDSSEVSAVTSGALKSPTEKSSQPSSIEP